ncbi:MAG TPA: epoxide hydrolase [Thermoanaerobaculia bacterium]|nr:epoxide hydrolase [Thermoanaerobaculia bacterium]
MAPSRSRVPSRRRAPGWVVRPLSWAAGWDYGTNLDCLRGLVAYWADGFDWRAQEERLNAFDHFRAEVAGIGVHFVHERGSASRPLPIIVSQGWPSTFVEMLALVPRLAHPERYGGDPEDAFDVVVPSLPGFGFSDRPVRRGMTKTRVAALWAELMTRHLGHERFAVRGGDIGSGISAFLGLDHADHVIGIHVSDALRPYLGPGAPPLSAAEEQFLAGESAWMAKEGAYDHLQATKPQTLAYGLQDSPAGLAAWIVEKLRGWSDCAGVLERRFSPDEILTHLTIYWVTGTIHSANRMYFERDQEGRTLARGERVEVPCAVTIWPGDIDHPPREWAERAYRVERWTEMPRGGHFAAHEEPDLLAADIREFFRPLR